MVVDYDCDCFTVECHAGRPLPRRVAVPGKGSIACRCRLVGIGIFDVCGRFGNRNTRRRSVYDRTQPGNRCLLRSDRQRVDDSRIRNIDFSRRHISFFPGSWRLDFGFHTDLGQYASRSGAPGISGPRGKHRQPWFLCILTIKLWHYRLGY